MGDGNIFDFHMTKPLGDCCVLSPEDKYAKEQSNYIILNWKEDLSLGWVAQRYVRYPKMALGELGR